MKYFILIIAATFLLSCSSNNEENENCRFLLDVPVNENVNLSFPIYSELQFAGNSVWVPGVGNAGIIVAFTGGDYFAWDAADPNHPQSSCSILEPSGLNATCGCDDKNEYSLVSGQPLGNNNLRCGLKNYRVQKSGNILTVFN